jgi:hypothetical protein
MIEAMRQFSYFDVLAIGLILNSKERRGRYERELPERKIRLNHTITQEEQRSLIVSVQQ